MSQRRTWVNTYGTWRLQYIDEVWKLSLFDPGREHWIWVGNFTSIEAATEYAAETPLEIR